MVIKEQFHFHAVSALQDAAVSVTSDGRPHLEDLICSIKYYVCKLLWDFTIVTGSSLQHNLPDITMVLKQTNKVLVYLLDIAIPGDSRLLLKSN